MKLMTPLLVTAILHLPLPAQADERQPVTLNTTQQTFVLGHMKSMLETIAAIQLDLSQGQPELVAERVMQLKAGERQSKPKGIGKSFPEGFKAMSREMNKHWKALLQPTQDVNNIQQELHLILNQCNACHRSYQLVR